MKKFETYDGFVWVGTAEEMQAVCKSLRRMHKKEEKHCRPYADLTPRHLDFPKFHYLRMYGLVLEYGLRFNFWYVVDAHRALDWLCRGDMWEADG